MHLIIVFLLMPAALLLQAAGEIPTDLLNLIDTLLRLSSLALLVIPVTEVRRVLGGLPAIPLPGGNAISAGRWFSWLVAGGVAIFGHSVGWLSAPDFADFQAWYAIEVAILAGIANIIYERFWREQIGVGIEISE